MNQTKEKLIFAKILQRSFLLVAMLFLFSACKGDSSVSIDSEGGLADTKISIDSGNNQFVAVGNTFANPLVVKLTGSNVEGVPIFFQIVGNSANATLSSSTVNSDSNGRAQINVTAGASSGKTYVKAKVVLTSTERSVQFTLNINGSASDWEVTQVGGSANVNAGETFQINIKALLSGGGADPSFNGNKYLTFTTTNGTSPGGNAPDLPADGLYGFTNGVINSDLDVTFYDSSENGTDTFDLTVEGSSVTAGTMTAIEVLDEVPASVRIVDAADCTASEILDTTFAVPVSTTIYSLYYDQYGNCVEAIEANSNWSKEFLDTQLTFDSSTTGVDSIDLTPVQGAISEATAFSITDTTYGFTDTTGEIALSSGSASQFLITGLDSSGNYTLDAGDTVELLIEARDVFGNLAVDYTGSKTLNFSTTATATSPPTGTVAAQSPDIPSNGGTYTFSNGILTSGDVDLQLFNALETPTVYVEDSTDTSINGTSPPITVNLTSHTYTRVRDASSNGGALTSASTVTADDTELFYCATYDSQGNYIQDDTSADWTYDGVITAGELSSVTDASSLTYTPSNVGSGSVTCNVGGITDNSGTYTINPGTPTTIALADGGTTSFASNFSETAGSSFAILARLYDQDGNHATNFDDPIDLTFSFIGSTNVDTSIPSEITPTITSTQVNSTNSNSENMTITFSSGDATVSGFMLINDATSTDRVKIQADDNDGTYDITTVQSGLITIGDGALAFISIRDGANNTGSVVNADTLTNDQSITLYAAGYDASGNYIADQSVTWSTSAGTSSCTDGDLSSTTGSSISYNPSSTGTCTITGDAGSGITDDTGAVASSNGVADSFSITILGGGSNITAGENFGLRITVLDEDGNRVFNYTPATTYTITSTLTSSPEGTAADSWSVTTSDFVFGEALLFPLKAYNAQDFTVTVTETVGGTAIATTSSTFTVDPATLDHYATQNGSGTYTADGTTTFSVELEARDEYGNATLTGITANTVNSITAIYSSGDETTVNTIGGFSSFTFGGGSETETISGLTYDISHEIEFVVADSGGITTPSGQRLSATFTPSDDGIASYEIFNISDTTPTAGDVITAQIRALDSAGNVITDGATDNVDSALDGYTFTVTLGSSANDSEYGDSPAASGLGAISFTDGVSSTFNLTFYNDETILGTDIDVSDGVGNVGDAGSNDITVSVDALDHYSNDEVVGGSIDGDGTTTFSATINARDQYGNIVAGDSSITLSAVPQDGHTVGTLGGTKVLNMTSGTTSVSDLTYNAAGSIKLGSSGGTASIDNATGGRSTVYTFDSTIGAVDNYLVTIPDGAAVTAGDNTYRVQITARDSSNNTIEDATVDSALSARTFTISGFAASPEGTAFAPAAGFTWSGEVNTGQEQNFSDGIAIVEITPVNAETITEFTVTDSSGITGTYSGSITISPASFNKIVIAGASSGVADGNSGSPTDYSATVTGRDTYGNLTVAPGGTGYTALALTATRISGAASTGTVVSDPATIDLTSNSSTSVDVNYNVAHTTRFSLDDGGAAALIDTTLTPIVTWTIDSSVVASYTLTANDTSPTAGTQTTYRLTAYDTGGNQIIGEDSTLDGITFDFSGTSTDCDAPNTASTSIVGTINGTAFASATSVTAAGVNGGFSNGIWDIPVTLYNTNSNCGAIGFLDIDDTDNTINVTSTNAASIQTSSAYYVITTAANFPQDADNSAKTTTSITATLYDQYGNEKSNSSVSGTYLSLNKISGYGSSYGTVYACGPTGGGAAANYGDGCSTPIDLTSITLDFDGTATQTIYDLSYDVGNVIDIRFNDGSGVTTEVTAASAEDITWNTVTGTVGSYTFVNPAGPLTSGVSANWTITALDRAGNTITGIDGDLDGMSLSITDETSGDFDAPDSSNNWTRSIAGFSSGIATASMTIYSDQDVANADFTLVDATNSINTSNSGGAVTVNSETNCDRFEISTTNLSSSPDADGNAILNTDATISCVDSFGNLTSYSGGNTIRLDIVHVTDAQAYGANEGTLKACSYIDGNGCGSPTDITGQTLDFTSPNQTRTIHDLSYDVGHDLYIRAYEDGGTIDTAEANSDRIEWEAVAGTIASYNLTPVAGSANAGSATSWEVRAFDAASNQMTNENGLNDTILSARDLTVVETGAGSGNMDGPTSGSVTLPSSVNLTFSSGVGTFSGGNSLTFLHSDNDVQTNYLQVQDELSNTGSQTAGMTIDPEGVGAKFEVTATGTFPGEATNDHTTDSDTEATITMYDQYGNETTDSTVNNASITASIQTSDANYSTTGTLKACGPASSDANNGDGCGTPIDLTTLSYDFTSSTTQVLYDFSYDVSHDVEIIIGSTARGGITTASGDSADLTWNPTSKIVNSYTLTFDDATANAGDTTNLSLTAYDKAGNVLDQAETDSTLEALTFNFSATADNDAPTSGDTVAANDPANGSSFTFNSGVATVPYVFYKDRNVLGTADEITITDENSVTVTPDDGDSIDIDPNTAVDIVFTSSAHTTTAGECSSAVTVETRDTYGNVSNVASNLTITLGEDSGTMNFFSDNSCSTGITDITITSGNNSGTFYYTDTNDGTTNLSLSSSYNDPSAQAQTITPNTAVNLVFTSSAHSTTAGECSSAVTIESRDTYGNTSNVASNLTVTLTEDSGTMSFFSDNSCSTGITDVTITTGNSGANFYYTDTNDGTTNLGLSSSYNDPSDQAQTITPNTAVNLVFTSSAHTTTAGECSSAVTIETRDTHGNTSNVASNLAVTLGEDSGTMSFFSDNSCSTGITDVTITTGNNSGTFYYTDTNDGTTNLSLSSSYNDPSAQAQTITPNTAVNLVFTSSAHSTTAGGCSSAVTIETRDTHGNTSNVASNLTVTLGEDSGTMNFFSDNSCSTGITDVTITTGNSGGTFYYTETNDGTTNLSLSSSYNDPSAQAQTITPNTAVNLVFTSSAHTTTAGECSSSVTIETRDTHGNTSNVASNLTVTLGEDSGTMSFFSDNSCSTGITDVTITTGNSGGTFYYTDTNDGTTNLSLSSSYNDPSAQAQTITPNTAVNLVFTSSAHSTTAGECSSAVTIETRDTHGNTSNVASNLTITLGEDSGTMNFFSDNSCSTGITDVTITTGNSTGTFYYTDTNDGTTNLSLSSSYNDPSAQAQTITPNTAVNLVFTSSSHSTAAGDCSSAVTIETRDTHGNTSNVASNLTVTLGEDSGTMNFFSDNSCSTGITDVTISTGNSGGTFYYTDTNDGTTNISLSSSYNDPSDQAQTITPNTAVNLVFTSSGHTTSAGDCSSAVTIETRDTHGNTSNVASNLTVTLGEDSGTMSFFSDNSCSTGITDVTITTGNNSGTFYYTETNDGTTNLSLSSSYNDPSAQAQTVNPNTAVNLVFTSSAHSTTAGECSSAVTIGTQDTHGNTSNVASNLTVTLGEDSGTMNFFSDNSCSTGITDVTITTGNNSGTFYYTDTNDGTTNLSLSSSYNDPSAQGQTITPNTAVNLVFTSSAHSTAAGDCSSAVTIETRDTHGNTSNVASNLTVTLGEDSGTMSFFSDNSCSTGITDVTISSGNSGGTFYYTDTNDGTTNLSLSSSYNDPSAQAQTITPNTAVDLVFTSSGHTTVAGDCSAAVNLETRDTHGNASNVASNLTITLGDDSGTMSFFSDNSCSTGITDVTITTGNSSGTFYYTETNDGTTNLSLTSSYNDPSDQAQTITPNTAVNLVFTSSAHSTTAGECSSAVTIGTQDTHGNTSNVAGNLTVTLGEDSGTMSFFSDNSCSTGITDVTITTGNNSGTFYYTDTNDGTTNLSLSSSYNDPSAQAQTITPNTAVNLVFTSSGHTTTAGVCSSAVTIETRDTHGNTSNVASNLTVTLGEDSGTMNFFSDNSCSTGITDVTITTGNSGGTFYYTDTNDGTTNISLSSSYNDPSNQAQTINPNTATNLHFVTSGLTETAGECSGVVTIETRDTHGNDSNVGSNLTVNLSASTGTMTYFSDASCSTGIGSSTTITSGTNTVNFYYKDTTAGTSNLSLSSSLIDPSAQAQTINHNSIASLSWDTETVANQVINEDFPTAGVVDAFDAHGNPITDVTPTIVLSKSTNSDCSSDDTTNLSNNTAAVSSGSASFANVQLSAAGGPYYFKASVQSDTSINTCTTGSSTVYAVLSSSPASGTVSALASETFEISGGAPALTCNDLVTDNSGATITSSCYTGGCAGDVCIDYTAGAQGNVTDQIRVTDAAGNQLTVDITVNGANFAASSETFTFPGGDCGGGGTSSTITIANNGNVNATSVSRSISGDAEFSFNPSHTCGSTDTDLNTGGADTCNIIVDFDGSSGNFSTDITIEDTTNGGKVTVQFDASCP